MIRLFKRSRQSSVHVVMEEHFQILKCVCGQDLKRNPYMPSGWSTHCDDCAQKEWKFENAKLHQGRNSRFSCSGDYTWEEKIALTAVAQGIDYVSGRNARPRIRSGWLVNAKIQEIANERQYEVIERIDILDVAALPTVKKCGNPRSRTKMGKAREILRSVTQCSYCGRAGDQDNGPDGKKWHIDHIIPIAKNGTNELNNLCKACATCNTKKGDRLVAVAEGAMTAQDVLDAAMENLRNAR